MRSCEEFGYGYTCIFGRLTWATHQGRSGRNICSGRVDEENLFLGWFAQALRGKEDRIRRDEEFGNGYTYIPCPAKLRRLLMRGGGRKEAYKERRKKKTKGWRNNTARYASARSDAASSRRQSPSVITRIDFRARRSAAVCFWPLLYRRPNPPAHRCSARLARPVWTTAATTPSSGRGVLPAPSMHIYETAAGCARVTSPPCVGLARLL